MGIIRVGQHSLSKTESPPAGRAIAQILMGVREIAPPLERASQEPVLTNGAPRVRIEIIWLPKRNPLHDHSLFSGASHGGLRN